MAPLAWSWVKELAPGVWPWSPVVGVVSTASLRGSSELDTAGPAVVSPCASAGSSLLPPQAARSAATAASETNVLVMIVSGYAPPAYAALHQHGAQRPVPRLMQSTTLHGRTSARPIEPHRPSSLSIQADLFSGDLANTPDAKGVAVTVT